MTEKRHQPIDFTNIRDLLSVVFKRKYTILAVFVVVFGAAALYAFLAPRIYEAKSILLVKLGREFMRTSEGANSSPALSVQPETIMKSEISILTSKDLMTRVIRTLGIDRIYPAIAKASAAQPTRSRRPSLPLKRIEGDEHSRVGTHSGRLQPRGPFHIRDGR
jgi:uncharacterized protein involved in exopolysaccharide biosynthesis